MSKENKNSGLYLGLLVSSSILVYGFLQLQFNFFQLPYFWDELGVYSQSAIYTYEHGIGLLPSALPDELSRGHPILLQALWAMAFKLFGCTPLVARLFASFISIIGLVYLYKLIRLYVEPRFAYFLAITIFIQPCFLSQSGILLPEFPLSIAALAAAYHFLNKQDTACMLALIVALFIKESAVILPAAIGLHLALNRKVFTLQFFKLCVIPVLAILLYFCIQYFQRSYFLYPLHTSLLKFEWYFIRERFNEFYEFVILNQGRLLVLLLGIISIYIYSIRSLVNRSAGLKNSRSFKLLLIYLSLGIIFCSLNYFLNRYVLFILIFLYVGVAIVSYQVHRYAVITLLGILIFNAIYYAKGPKYSDVDFTYTDHIRTSVDIINYLKNDEFNEQTIVMAFPLNACLWEPKSGYFDSIDFYASANYNRDEIKANYYIFTKPGNMDQYYKSKEDYILLKEFKSGFSSAILCKYKE